MITVAERNEVLDDASFRIASRVHKAVTGVAEVSRFVLSGDELNRAAGCRLPPEKRPWR